MKNPLLDTQFLKELDLYPHKNKYVRIISLDKNDYPREQIEGVVTGGSINIDGASAVRRTCSLTFGVPDPNAAFTDAYWAFENKFKLEIGLHNYIDPSYPDIIWFKQGVYIITSFSKSTSTNSINISISGKDKMCRLNGDIGGNLTAQWDFGQYEEVDEEGNITLTKIPIPEIIQTALVQYGQERAENIIINDLDDNGWELWEYRGETPMYLFLKEDKETFRNVAFDDDGKVKLVEGEEYSLKELGTDQKDFKFYSLNSLDADYNEDADEIYWGNSTNQKCYIIKVENGETAGYHSIPLVYNSDLILNTGETLTSLLDKIKNMLGEFEYFYDLDGHFVFQKKKNYIQELFSPINGELISPIMTTTPYSYRFEDESLFSNISDSPQIGNVKNDFTVWGNRKGIAGTDIPIHVRYAIDKKPTFYKSPWDHYEKIKEHYFISSTATTPESGKTYTYYSFNDDTKEYSYIGSYNDYKDLESKPTTVYTLKTYLNILEASINISEVQEHIYQKVGQNYYKINASDIIDHYYLKGDKNIYTLITDFNQIISLNSMYSRTVADNREYSIDNYDWRELIYQMAIDFYKHNTEPDFLLKIEEKNSDFVNGRTGYEQYYVDIQGFWRQLYNPSPSVWDIEQYGEYYGENGLDDQGNDKYWNKKIHTDPNSLNFWFDMLDVGDGAGLSKYAVNKIGDRTKIDNNNSVKSIYFKETPEVQFVLPGEQIATHGTAYQPLRLQKGTQELFVRSSQGLSAISRVNELISQHTSMTEGISLTAIPIYYLEPNTRIYVKDRGDYVLTKISYQLNYNGTMNLNGTKITDTIY